MKSIEAATDPTDSDRPLLFFRIGALDRSKSDMPTRLAEEYGMNLVSGETDDPILETASHLIDQEDVVVDMSFPTREERKPPIRLAQGASALVIALNVESRDTPAHIEHPIDTEGIYHVIDIDGKQSTTQMLNHIAVTLGQLGLAETNSAA